MPSPDLKLDYATPNPRRPARRHVQDLEDATTYILYLFGALAAAAVLIGLAWSIYRLIP